MRPACIAVLTWYHCKYRAALLVLRRGNNRPALTGFVRGRFLLSGPSIPHHTHHHISPASGGVLTLGPRRGFARVRTAGRALSGGIPWAQESQALGRVAAIVENRIPDLSPIRVARLCDDPRAELAVLLRAYRTKPQDEDLERRMEQAFALIEGAELPAQIDATAYWSAYYAERAELRKIAEGD